MMSEFSMAEAQFEIMEKCHADKQRGRPPLDRRDRHETLIHIIYILYIYLSGTFDEVQRLLHGVRRVVARVERGHPESHPRQQPSVVVHLLHREQQRLQRLQPVLQLQQCNTKYTQFNYISYLDAKHTIKMTLEKLVYQFKYFNYYKLNVFFVNL